MPLSATEVKSDFDRIVKEVLRSGVPVEFQCGAQRLQIAPVPARGKLARLVARPGVIVGDPEDLVHMDWSKECHVDLR